MINPSMSEWSIFQVVPEDGQEGRFSIDSNDVLTATSISTSTLNIVGANIDIAPGDVVRFEVDAYAEPESKACVVVQEKAIGNGPNYDLSNSRNRSLKYVPEGAWTHCVVTYRMPLDTSSRIANASCGFPTAGTGSAKFKNPKVFVNNTQIKTNKPLSFFTGTTKNYAQFIGSSIDIEQSLQNCLVNLDNSTNNRIFSLCGGARCEFTFHDAILGLKRYDNHASRIKLTSCGGTKIGSHSATPTNTDVGVIEFWSDGDSAELESGSIFCRRNSADAGDGYAPSNIVFSHGVVNKGIVNSLIIYGLTENHGVAPGVDDEQYLGISNHRWNTIYCTSGTINTSDVREKDNVSFPSDALMRAWGKVNFKVFQMKDAIEKKGAEQARLHVGVIAQEVAEAFASEGLDASRYGLFCYDKWEDEYEAETVVDVEEHVNPETGEIIPAQTHVERRLVTPAGSRYGIRYEEALALECAYQRWHLKQLEERINQLNNSNK